MHANAAVSKPALWQSLAECRALLEVMSLSPARPLLRRAPSGDGQPVLVFPGFFAADRSTATLRRFLNSKGFTSYAWEEGRNPGISDALYRRLESRTLQLQEAHGRRISLVGWSLGGIYARLIAHRNPDSIRQVITLGSPFSLNEYGAVSGPVARLYQRMNPGQSSDPMLKYADQWRQAPPVPSTAIYSEGDGIAHWSYCVDEEDDQTENLRIPGSHLGMTHNPLMLYCIADRLAQPEGQWRRFKLIPHLLDRLVPSSG
jgi:pimeloyl-ACP methyl ester carboxylesterase